MHVCMHVYVWWLVCVRGMYWYVSETCVVFVFTVCLYVIVCNGMWQVPSPRDTAYPPRPALCPFPSSPALHQGRAPHRLALGVADATVKQREELGAQHEAVEGERAETLLHGPVLAWGLVGVQAGVGRVPVTQKPDASAAAAAAARAPPPFSLLLFPGMHLCSSICCSRSSPSGGPSGGMCSPHTFRSSLDG